MKKKTGDPSCPPSVRRAKHIARSILSRAVALPVDGESSTESAEAGSVQERNQSTTGSSAGMQSTVGTACSMSERMGEISRALQVSPTPPVDITAAVKREVESAMAPTVATLLELKEMISSLVSSKK
eukprot:IDg2764t1